MLLPRVVPAWSPPCRRGTRTAPPRRSRCRAGCRAPTSPGQAEPGSPNITTIATGTATMSASRRYAPRRGHGPTDGAACRVGGGPRGGPGGGAGGIVTFVPSVVVAAPRPPGGPVLAGCVHRLLGRVRGPDAAGQVWRSCADRARAYAPGPRAARSLPTTGTPVPRTHRLAILGGDGIGPEVVDEGLKVLDRLEELEGFTTERVSYDLGGRHYLETGEVLSDEVLEELRGYDAIYLGAVGTPDVPPGVLEKGLLLKLRFAFDQYVNQRPVKLYPGVASPVGGPDPRPVRLRGGPREHRIGLRRRRRDACPGHRRRRSRPRSRSTPASGWTGCCATPSTWLRRATASSRCATRPTC